MKSKRSLVAWVTGLVVVMAGLVGTVGVNAAQADDPAPSPPISDGPSSSSGDGSTSDAGPNAESDSTDPTQPLLTTATTSESTPTPTATTCVLCPPDNYVPTDRTWFNHPFVKSSASDIREMVTRTVRSVPSGGTIKLAEFSLNDNTLVDALIAAKQRGVTVQVVVNNHNVTGSIPRLGTSASFIRLSSVLGTNRSGGDPEHVSFARYCHSSCRGSGGNVHYKLFLFSSVGKNNYDPTTGAELPVCAANTTSTLAVPCATSMAGRNITMMGSPNLTTMAAYGQWNHLDVYANQTVYDYYLTWFAQMRNDKPLKSPYENKYFSNSPLYQTWTFPKPGTTASNDPIMQALNQVSCNGATGGTGYNGRTKIRLGAYTFYDNRGRYLSKKVRALWNAGCDIAIEYAIMGDTVKRTLYSASGRGRIPMRQVVTFTRSGQIDAYDHAKWIGISGNFGGKGNTWITYTGTTNISDLGFRSDDTQQVWRDKSRTEAYLDDFYTIWRQPQAHVPSPFSSIGARIGSPKVTLGKGRYGKLEPN